ncbi:MAG: energy transducer TonB, partial [Hyphomicrobiaceae bacterium]|nr:energy transducer TonB [Hyphomicrobiaceae bacterium]
VRIGAFKNFGTVTVQFEVDRSGRLLTRKVLESSGHQALDQKAIDWIDKAEFPPLPDALNAREVFTIPLIFQRAG